MADSETYELNITTFENGLTRIIPCSHEEFQDPQLMGQELRRWQDGSIIYALCYMGKRLDNLTNYQVRTLEQKVHI